MGLSDLIQYFLRHIQFSIACAQISAGLIVPMKIGDRKSVV